LAEYTKRICKQCQQLFSARTRDLKIGKGSFCSRKCASIKENNPHWRGGRSEDHMYYKRRYPEKCAARKEVWKAIRKGILTKKPCLVCGKAEVHAHHPDYSKPLDVLWLCRKHHDIADRGELALLAA
jgi:hypothetical protein